MRAHRRSALLVAAAIIAAAGTLTPILAARVAAADPSPAPASSSQLITVNTASGSATTGSLSAWDRAADGTWNRVFGPVLAWVGRNGVGAAAEGTSITPSGTFPLTEAFGRLDNPGTAMPYFKADRNDWWDENSASPSYNLHVRQPNSPGAASENLFNTGASYDYAVNIGYNLGRVPNAGSGIFLHVTHNSPTAGCVAIDKTVLAAIMRWLDPARNPTIDIRVGAEWSPNTRPVGALDPGQLQLSNTAAPSYTFHGWSFDSDAPGQPIDVALYDTRPNGTSASLVVHADAPRPDVGAVFPAAGIGHGFAGSIGLGSVGRHTICAYGLDAAGGPNPLLGCQPVDVPGPAGALDAVSNPAPGVLTAVGWAADPMAPGGPVPVHVYLNGPDGFHGYPTSTGSSRNDVAAAIPWTGADTGYATMVPAPFAGVYQLCAFAIVVNGPNPLIGCRASTVTDVFGVLDGVSATGWQVFGWALNPNAPGGRVTVHVYDFGPTVRTFVLTADSSRPDVAAAIPGYDGNHGFSATLPAGAPGTHNICAYAINEQGGSGTNPVLGCRLIQI